MIVVGVAMIGPDRRAIFYAQNTADDRTDMFQLFWSEVLTFAAADGHVPEALQSTARAINCNFLRSAFGIFRNQVVGMTSFDPVPMASFDVHVVADRLDLLHHGQVIGTKLDVEDVARPRERRRERKVLLELRAGNVA